MNGVRLAVLYGLYPHRLGFCGPPEKAAKKELLKFLLEPSYLLEKKARTTLEGFKAAYAYYQLIAKANGIKDPLDEKVVRAYWTGNGLLKNVSRQELSKMVEEDFSGPGLLAGEDAKELAEKIPLGAKPHHSFHVYFIGSITGRIELNDRLRDLCRVSWGKVIKNSKFKMQNSKFNSQKEKLVIESQSIVKRKGKYILERAEKKEIVWDKRLMPKVKTGDWVAIHWNHLVEVLNKREMEDLKKYTGAVLKLING